VSVARRTRLLRLALTLVVLAVLAFTLQSLHMSGASFVTASSNPSNVFIAGNLGHVNNRNGQVLITASGMQPGDSQDGTMTLTGTGDLSGDYTLSVTNLVDNLAPLSGTLLLTVEDLQTGDVYEDLVSTFDPVDLGTISPGEADSYTVTLSYPDGPTNGAVQGASMSLTLQITGVSQ
jgi:hypothetical protein